MQKLFKLVNCAKFRFDSTLIQFEDNLEMQKYADL